MVSQIVFGPCKTTCPRRITGYGSRSLIIHSGLFCASVRNVDIQGVSKMPKRSSFALIDFYPRDLIRFDKVKPKRVQLLSTIKAYFDRSLDPLLFRNKFYVKFIVFDLDFLLQRINGSSPSPISRLLGTRCYGEEINQKEGSNVCHVFSAYSFGVSRLDLLVNPAGSSPSVEATTGHTVASPVTLTTVLNISRILSGAMIRAIPAAGTPIDSKTMINMIKPAPGTPAEPMEANVAVRSMMSCCVSFR